MARSRAGVGLSLGVTLLSAVLVASSQGPSGPPENAIAAMNLGEAVSTSIKCDKNHYYWGQWNNKPYCVQCPTGMVSAGCKDCKPDPNGESCDRLDSCPKGSFHSAPKKCDKCPAGKWQPMHGQEGCFRCPSGMFSSKAGSESCQQCPLHTYQDVKGQTSCQKCAHCKEGQYGYTLRVGSDAKAECRCTQCKAGKYSPFGYTRCFNCELGKFQPAVGAYECTACPAGKFQEKKGSIECASCKKGLMTPFDEATEAVDCVKASGNKHFCKAGRFISYHEEKMSYSCNKCPSGRFGGVVSGYQYGGRCFDCPAGKFQFSKGLTHCDACPHGYMQAHDQKGCIVTPTHMPTQTPTLQPTSAPTVPTTAAPTPAPTRAALPTPLWHNYVHRIPKLLPDPKIHSILSPWTMSPTPSPTLIPTHHPIECSMSQWKMASDCSVTCGEGFRTFERHILTPSKYDGHCGALTERRYCQEGPCPQHCVVSEWDEWSQCSKSCSSGSKSRTRTVVKHGDKNGYTCPLLAESISCNGQPCPVDCILMKWSKWSSCSATCGGGQQFRSRRASRETVYGGKCKHRRENKKCSTHVCPVNCLLSKWSAWKPCSTTCGSGIAERFRRLITKPSHGGVKCPVLSESKTCQTAKNCPIDCKMAKWNKWSPCTISCAPIDKNIAGTWNRTRLVKSKAEFGGKACPPKFQSMECNRYNICPVHCTVSKWTAWKVCTATCGGGVSIRTRSIKVKARHSGAHCPSLQQSKKCNMMVCPTPVPTETPTPAPTAIPTTIPTNEATLAPTAAPSFAPTMKPVHCKVSKWGKWSPSCTKSCGSGYKVRSREVTQDPLYYGESCPPLTDQKICNKQPCPLDCETSDWGDWSECTVSCGKGKQTRTRRAIAKVMNGGKKCPALSATRTCASPCPSHCVLSKWTTWGKCSTSCGTGAKTRSRSVVKHALHGGYACPELSQSQTCNTHACPINCKVALWTKWSTCDKSCGVGKKSRTRKILTEQSTGGTDCPVLFEETTCEIKECTLCRYSRWAKWTTCSQTCGGGSRFRRRRSAERRSRSSSTRCPRQEVQTEMCNPQPCATDCVVNQWDKWGPCDKSCGVGTHSRIRRIHRYASMGGQACPSLAEKKVCNAFLCPEDCQVGKWGRWSRCTKACDGGKRRRSRRVTQKAANGGQECPAASEREDCNTHFCERDCELSAWSALSECTRTCGSGHQTHTRTVVQAPIGKGKACGPLSEVKTCHFGHCAVDCVLSEWSEFTRCTKSCDGGKQTRRRDVIRRPAFGGAACATKTEQWPCNVNRCPIDCQTSKWTTWTPCSKTCTAGTHSRKRSVMLKPSFGGKECGELAQTAPCTEGPCPIGCDTTPWQAWTACSQKCGTGTQGRMRHITNMDPSKKGFMCPLLWETRPCNDHPCQGDCEVSSWTEWTACDRTCNGGLRWRAREVKADAVAGGKECPALSQHKRCNRNFCPEDCQLSSYGPWSPCTKTCGTGSRTRSKAILADHAYGGKECPLEEIATEDCSTQRCPVDCVLSDWSHWSECTVSCGSGEQVRTRTVEQPSNSGGKPCGDLTAVKICMAPPHAACPIDCQVGKWSNWTDCSASCDTGNRLRVRPVSIMEAFGGKACPPLSQRERCNTQTCPADCQTGRWSRWSPCSTTCGQGRQRKTRKVTQNAMRGGAKCPTLEFVQSCTEGVCPMHCVVSKWSEWSACTVTCGAGSQARTRSVEQHAFHGGYKCPALREKQSCGGQRCPRDCEVGRWSRWSTCAVTCGKGSITRTRRIRRRPSYGGRVCPELTEESDCANFNCPIDCVVARFGDWSACSSVCGSGVRVRERSVNIQNDFGGKLCPALEERKHCKTDKPCPQACVVNEWKPWTKCGVSCGGGKAARWRTIKYMPMVAGVKCPAMYEVKDCNSHECPVDCSLSPWESIGVCSTTCGKGIQQKRRVIVAKASNGGSECPSEADRIRMSACDGVRPCPTKCQVSAWGVWSICSKTCGMGSHSRTRAVVKKAGAGYTCPALKEKRECNDQPCPTDCVLGKWGPWTACKVTCGTGERWRKRVIVQATKFGGAACAPAFKTKQCGSQPCPEDCVMSKWGKWNECTQSCGGGSTTRSRTISHDNRFGGKACPNLDMWKACNKQSCPIDCIVSHYGEWSSCSRSCGGGLSVRTRSVVQQNRFNGLRCPSLKEEMPCNRIPCALDCKTGKWVDSTCSKSCGGGTKTRTRAVQQAGADGGKGCPALQVTKSCNKFACPIDCRVSDWLPLGKCSKTCGKGVRTEHRKIEIHAQFGGVPCTSNISFAKMVPCTVSSTCPVHCDVTGWGVWSDCDKTCTAGTKTRTRSIVRHASLGGYSCPSLMEKRECNSGPCPVHCEVSNWSPWSACSTTCDSDEKLGSFHRIRKVTTNDQHGGANCPKMYESEPCSGWRTKCPVHCSVSGWSVWSHCTKSCGGGHKVRSRTVVAHAKHDGYVCPSLKDTEPCGTDVCPSKPGVILAPPTPAPSTKFNGCLPGEKVFINWHDSATMKTNIVTDEKAIKSRMASNGGRDAEILGHLKLKKTGPWKISAEFETTNLPGTNKKDFVKVSIDENNHGKVYNNGFGDRVKKVTAVIPEGKNKAKFRFRWFSYTQEATLHMSLVDKAIATCMAKDQNCILTQFGKWGTCSKTCGGGWQTRKRKVAQPRKFGGRPCPGAVTEHRECNDWLCPWEHVMEAESAFDGLSKSGSVALVNKHTLYKGYTGQGYLQFGSSLTDTVSWQFVAPFTGRYELAFRYALGGHASTAVATTEHMEVDHTYAVNCDFRNTGGWNHWSYSTVGVDLRSGMNTISLSPAEVGLLHLDSVKVTHAKYLQHCKPGTQIPLHWLQSGTKNLNVVYGSRDEKTRSGATIGSEEFSGELRGRIELGAMGPWDIHLNVAGAWDENAEATSRRSLFHDFKANINGKPVSFALEGNRQTGGTRKLVIKDGGAHLSYDFNWETLGGKRETTRVLDGVAICSGCSHTKCSFEHSEKLGSKITVHHHNKEYGGSNHHCQWDHGMDQCSCRCQFHPFMSKRQKHKIDRRKSEAECKNEPFFKLKHHDGTLKCDRSTEWLSGGRLKMESRNGAYLTGIEKTKCRHVAGTTKAMIAAQASKDLKKGIKVSDICVAKAACCDTGVSQHREQQCKDVVWTKTKQDKATYKAETGWSSCPAGFFITTMDRRHNSMPFATITGAKCCKNMNGPSYGDCVTIAAEKSGWSTCGTGYFMTGIHRHQGCTDLDCVSNIRCCKPFDHKF